MSKAQGAAALVLLFLILCVASVDTYLHATDTGQEWEYRIESFSDDAFLLSINTLGAQGWDLASARRAISGEGSSSKGVYECIFKRRKGDAATTQANDSEKK